MFSDRELGLDRAITRRDFIQGVAVAATVAACADRTGSSGDSAAPAGIPATYPPSLTGLRGAHQGAFEVAHALRDGTLWQRLPAVRATGERYDLVVVGGGLSGLAAAYFYRAARPNASILVLENHDDFGGHARRNEFRVGDRLLLGYAGTQAIESPAQYSGVARRLLAELGVDTQRFYQYFDQKLYDSLGLTEGVYFDQETFGRDALVPLREDVPLARQLATAPLGAVSRAAIARLHDRPRDALAGKSAAEKASLLASLSYQVFLTTHAKVPAAALPFFQRLTHPLFGVGIDAVSALDCWGIGLPGFAAMKLDADSAPRLGRTPRLSLREDEPYIFHFPDGNASLARLLVRSLLPRAAPGSSMEDSVLGAVDYGELDRATQRVRLRLNSTVVRVRHEGEPARAKTVEVTYVQGGEPRSVRAAYCVLACWHGIIPRLSDEFPAPQQDALRYGVKVPLIYTNAVLRNWRAFKALGVESVRALGGYYHEIALDFPVSMGGYRCPTSPDEPIVVHLERTPCSPGRPARDQQRVGRTEMLATSYEQIERATREQLARILGPGGFDPAADILAITVNRWPHGYAYEYNSLWDPEWTANEAPCEVARRPLGRIAIANSDAEAYAYTDAAINQAYRAVQELTDSTRT